jgi:hypothetical protein
VGRRKQGDRAERERDSERQKTKALL